MKIYIPIKEVSDLSSVVYEHFGSAPAFVLVDSETRDFNIIENPDQHHAKGMCTSTGILSTHEIDSVVVGGIGSGALMKLNRSGIDVYKATATTVKENLELLRRGELPEFSPGHVRSGHSSGGDCAH